MIVRLTKQINIVSMDKLTRDEQIRLAARTTVSFRTSFVG